MKKVVNFLSAEKKKFNYSLKDAILDLVAFYFVFDVVYPKHLNAVLLFFQHYVFQLMTSRLSQPKLLS